MAARSRITVLLLLFLLSTEHSFAVDQNKLTSLVNELLSKYRFNGMFSLAVSIPQNQNQNQNQDQNQGANRIIQEVLNSDPADDVKNKINMDEVYVGSRMVAAKVLKWKYGADHAESRVVDNWDQLYNSTQFNQEDLLLFYVYASPCVEKCTSYGHTENILSRINNIQRWNNYAVVFSKIFKPRNGRENTDQERIEALERLATFKGERGPIGLENIFRCDRKENKPMQCVSCSSNGQVAHECVSDDPPSASTNICPQPGTGDSSSQGGVRGNMNKRRGDRVRRDISCNTGDSNKGAEDAPSVDGNGSDLRTAEDVSSPQIGFDSGDGNGEVSRGKGKGRSETYDSVTDKFMDFSFEKTHSAYMLFYKRVDLEEENGKDFNFDVSPDLLEWIWHDNMQFLQDKNIFEHTYFGFMWQLCSSIPSTLPDPKAVSLMTAKVRNPTPENISTFDISF
ncbi:uncharacterized protein LOC117769410 [Hippoglossus hippoglossus]|uniref:uncharacterized protein LOC117769410 n=1 Tax=Hippoglossus hippoglossus TaxID=8267 RepID=UPI00148D2316|nr:uncharacterized protein LOC117769410 [Hippoglossus hippoglossus]